MRNLTKPVSRHVPLRSLHISSHPNRSQISGKMKSPKMQKKGVCERKNQTKQEVNKNSDLEPRILDANLLYFKHQQDLVLTEVWLPLSPTLWQRIINNMCVAYRCLLIDEPAVIIRYHNQVKAWIDSDIQECHCQVDAWFGNYVVSVAVSLKFNMSVISCVSLLV